MADLPKPGEIAGRDSDLMFFSALTMLPNPDPILRKAGKSEAVFDAIQSDAHVIGELRSIKTDFQRFKYRLTPGGDRRVDRRAYELCQSFLDREPAPNTLWADVFWNIAQDTFRGLSAHEIVWEKSGDVVMPAKLLDRPKRRFMFNGNGDLRVLTRADMAFGLPAEELYFLVSRHMPTYDQPYGVALFSSCYWPYVFKHMGYKWLVKFCERHGLPFPKATYPVGAQKEAIDALEKAVHSLIESGYAVFEEGSNIDLLESKGASAGGKLAQHQLVELSNAEMSKALTSQTLATDQPNSGSRAAAETHAGRAGGVNEGDRDRIAATLGRLWALITKINCGDDAAPPIGEFVGDTTVSPTRATDYKTFSDLGGKPSRKAMAQDLGITLANPNDPDDQLTPAPKPQNPFQPPVQAPVADTAEFSVGGDQFPDQTAVDALPASIDTQVVMAKMLEPVFDELQGGVDPQMLKARLSALYPKLATDKLQQLLTQALFVSKLWGRLSAESERG